jgi:hypothetical protein
MWNKRQRRKVPETQRSGDHRCKPKQQEETGQGHRGIRRPVAPGVLGDEDRSILGRRGIARHASRAHTRRGSDGRPAGGHQRVVLVSPCRRHSIPIVPPLKESARLLSACK